MNDARQNQGVNTGTVTLSRSAFFPSVLEKRLLVDLRLILP